MSGYKPYPKYKDSGIQWMREIPDHWNTIQSRRIFEQRKDRAYPDDEQLTASQKYGIVTQKEFMEIEGQKVVQVILGADILKHVEPNDFVISMRSFQGGIEFSPIRGCISSAYVMLIPSNVVYPPYFKWVFKSQAYIQALQATSNLVRDGQALRFENFSMVDLPIIPDSEQQAIAKFLDRETSRIDTLIQEQRELIELLKEKRQAVISNAVTKGLNPKAKMKDSGVEWIGEIPAHWTVSRLGYESYIRARLGWKGLKAEEYVDVGYVFLSTPNIKGKEIDFENVNFITQDRYDESPEIKLSVGDVLLAKDGSTLGTVNVVRSLTIPATVNSSIAVITPKQNIESQFLYYSFIGDYIVNLIQSIKGGMGVPHLFQEDLNRFALPLPPINEQKNIVEVLDREIGKLDQLVSEAESAIELMQEHRASLISEAVTGKIDVRGINVK